MKRSDFLAVILLVVMFGLLLGSSKNDSAIFDETAHVGAGYTYVRYQDSRLNPEHPPLIKDLAALPLLLLNLNFSTDRAFWTLENVHDRQWAAGNALLYDFENDPDQILFWSRLPIMLLAILFGWLFYQWVHSLYGGKVALLALFFYALSPTILAHSRFVTTDIAAAFGFFIGLAAFLKFLEDPRPKRLAVAGIAFGIAQLLKFSLFLLVPIYVILIILWAYLHKKNFGFFKNTASLFSKTILIGLIGLIIIYAVYAFHVRDYPPEQQLADASYVLKNFGVPSLANTVLSLIQNEWTRPLGQYFLGLLMVLQRAGGGNTTYFFGEVSANGWPSYFPFAYLVKETLAFHILTILALFIAARSVLYKKEKSFNSVLDWMRRNFALTASIIFVLFYWTYSVFSTLNIGVRHVLPTFPFIYLLVSRKLVSWIYRPQVEAPQNFFEWLKKIYKSFIEPLPRVILISLLCLWLTLSTLLVYPFFLSYYNEFIGSENGYWYIVDSNYDWGQDLKRLQNIVEAENIEKINLDYFGGGSPSYYLGEKFEGWWSARGAPPSGEWLAVSVSTLMGAWGTYDPELKQKPEDNYSWLRGMQPVRRAGASIFIYRMP